MEKIKVTVPFGMSKAQEIAEIIKVMGKQLKGGSVKFIEEKNGTMLTIDELETQITIVREPVEEIIATQECMACSTSFEIRLGKRFYTNYGGVTKLQRVCGEKCRSHLLSVLGSRASMKKDFRPMFERNAKI